ncbi:hypothetical protein [Phyllobacterium zundukense]|uniref:Uncharacterized protein n=1 Tax=Phyllobacterium zundukense TaxID=1867719 RepID=A0ACD4D6L1_9HYPH|nr:hypothetical protein [Phyllobacterium zundukense]UXN61482.1 hypothetical protein N8E88_15570 [Phyllobacterium zundukense]
MPANALNGIILNSPILDEKTDCYGFYVSCGGALPTYTMVKAFHDKSLESPGFGVTAFLTNVRAFAATFNDLYTSVFSGVVQKTPDRSKWTAYLQKPEAADFLNKLYQLTGIGKTLQPGDSAADNPWIANPNMDSSEFAEKFAPAQGKLEIGDGRKFLPRQTVDPALDRTDINYEYVKRYQADFIGYKAQSTYVGYNGKIIDVWDYEPKSGLSLSEDRWRTTIPDLAYSMTLNKELKVLIQHGYYDLNTPFHQSEINIKNAGLSASIPVKTYGGGHGVGPYSTDDYDKVLGELKALYDQPPANIIAAFNSPVPEEVKP